MLNSSTADESRRMDEIVVKGEFGELLAAALQRKLDVDLMADLNALKKFHAIQLLLIAKLAAALEELHPTDRVGQHRLMERYHREP